MATNKPINVLLIEDTPSDVRLVQEILRGSPSDRFTIISATTLAQGLDRLSSDHIDVILLDLGLPDSQGFETFQAIEERASNLPIIILTISANEELGMKAIRAGAQRFFSKDVLTPDGAYAEMFPQAIHYAIEHKRTEAELQRARDEVNALNKQLHIANEELEQRIDQRTTELQVTSEKLTVANAALKDSEARYRSLVERNFDGVIIHSDGIIRFANDAAARIMKAQSPDELIGMSALDLPTPPYRELIKQRVQSIYGDTSSELIEIQINALDGTIVDIELSGTLITYEGKPAVYAIARDISERKQMEAQLKQYAAHAEEHSYRQDILTQVITAGNKASDLETACAAMLDTAMELIPVTAGIISLLNEAADATELQYSRGLTDEVRDKARRLPLTIPNFVDVYHGTPLFMDDYTQQGTEQFRLLLPHLRITALVPLVEQNRVIGHYALSSERTQPFAEEERALLVAMGQQAGTVIARMQAEERVKRYAEQLEDLVEERTAQLAQSEEEFRTLFEASSIGQIYHNAAGHPMRINKAAAALLGIRDAASITHQSLWASPRISEEDKARLREGHAIQYEQEYDFRAIKDSGRFPTTRSDVRYISFYMLPLRKAADKSIDGYLAQLVDVTERKEAEASLAQSEAQYRTLVETANSIIIAMKTDRTITFINDYGARFFGYTPHELIGKDVIMLVPEVESTGRPLEQHVRDILARPDEYATNLNENITKDGRRVWVQWVNRGLVDNDGRHTGHLAVGIDVTALKHAETALKEAERLAAIGQTATMIGHDLRNPLQALQLTVDLGHTLFGSLPSEVTGRMDSAKVERLFSIVEQQIQYMDKIVSDLQDYARPLSPKRESVNVATLIDETLSLLSIPEIVGVRVNVLPSITATIDRHLMQRALSNLITNAVQAMPRGGEITIDAVTDDHTVIITIQDTGEGITDDMKEILFSPLITGKAKGTGLGLAVVKRIVEAHNGTITFESEEGKGTTFTVTLPQTAE